jgi:hypothetical protein
MSTDVSEAIALMMEAARTSETSVDIDLTTWQYIPEDSELHTRRRENLIYHIPPVLPSPKGNLIKSMLFFNIDLEYLIGLF